MPAAKDVRDLVRAIREAVASLPSGTESRCRGRSSQPTRNEFFEKYYASCVSVMQSWLGLARLNTGGSRVPLMARGFGVEKSLPGIRRELRSLGERMGEESPTPPKGGLPAEAGEAGPLEARSASSPPEPQPPAPTPLALGLPPIAAKADDLEAIKAAVDDAAAVSGALWFSYLFVLFYFAVAAGAVTHADLFFENPVKLPFLNIDLPLLAFFFLAPILFLIVHAYTLVHLVLLTDKAKRFDQALHDQIGEDVGVQRATRRAKPQLAAAIAEQYLRPVSRRAGRPAQQRHSAGCCARSVGRR